MSSDDAGVEIGSGGRSHAAQHADRPHEISRFRPLPARAPPPAPAPTGELRKVSQKYRCDVCGVELKMTMAPDEDPPPPRHCLEDMIEVAPLYD